MKDGGFSEKSLPDAGKGLFRWKHNQMTDQDKPIAAIEGQLRRDADAIA